MASRYVGVLMNSRTQAHAFHLMTNSFAQHKALQAYYEGIIPPMTEGSFLSVNYANNIFYIHDEGIWKLSIYDL